MTRFCNLALAAAALVLVRSGTARAGNDCSQPCGSCMFVNGYDFGSLWFQRIFHDVSV